MCAGFVYAQVLHACLQLRLFEVLADGPLALPALSERLGLAQDAALRLLDAAAALELVSRRSHGKFGLGALGAALIDNPGVASMVAHHAMFYADLADPVGLLRGQTGPTQLSSYWAYAKGAPADSAAVAGYSALMARSQPLVANEILDAYDVRRHARLMDVGGGEGVFLQTAAGRASALRLTLFDLPAVADLARARFAAAGLSMRAEAVGGSFLADALPRGADLISLVRVVHDHDDAAALHLLRAVHAALPRGGRLLLAEPMAGTPGAERMGDAYFGFYLLAMGSGRPRTRAVLTAMLRGAGFTNIRALRTATPLLTSVLLATA